VSFSQYHCYVHCLFCLVVVVVAAAVIFNQPPGPTQPGYPLQVKRIDIVHCYERNIHFCMTGLLN